jgi:hypothetical protein
LLTRPDTNTRQVYPDAVAEARPPLTAELWRAAAALAAEIAEARRTGAPSVLYIIYAGHGSADDDGHAYITLEDARIGGEELGRRVVDAAAADQTHVIVDACHSYYLAYERGPGGKRRQVHGFSELRGLGARSNVGLLLSTSSARESHEWEGFQAGVFSHEIRSGLHGAADVDRDGRVSYSEIAAFVARANQAIPNERFRPDVYARPPSGGTELIDLRPGLGRTLTIDRDASAGRYYLEDELGNRLADFHNSAGQSLDIIRPPRGSPLYLHRLGDEREFLLRPGPEHLVLSQLRSASSRSRPRGAAHYAFSLLFSLPFDQQAVREYVLATPAEAGPVPQPKDSAIPAPPAQVALPARPPWYRGDARVHDKLYLRLYAGVAYFSASEMVGVVGCPGCVEQQYVNHAGLGVTYGGAVGWAVVRNLILYFELMGTSVPSAETTATVYWREGPTGIDQLAFGPGLAYYLNPPNLYLASTLTFPKARLADQQGNMDLGIGVNVTVGKEWWLSANWGIGMALQAHFASMANSGCCGSFYFNAEVPRLNTRTLALLLSATYN